MDLPPKNISSTIVDIVNVPKLVFKVGRTTGWTAGKLNEVYAIRYNQWGEGRSACFIGADAKNKPFSKEGDSGSVIFSDKGHPIALIFGGSRLEDVTEAVPLDVILDDIKEQLGLVRISVVA